MVGFSSDLVFDGRKGSPYTEGDTPNPLNTYGRSKVMAEAAITATKRGLAIRTAAFFSPYDRFNFAHAVVETLGRGQPFEAADDQFISPTYVPELVEASLDCLIDGDHGIRHLANAGRVSWASFARLIAMTLEFDPALVIGRPGASFGWPAARPSDVALTSERPGLMKPLENALGHYADAVRPSLARPA